MNQILSEHSREEIVEKIHEYLQEIGAKVKKGEFPLEMFLIRKVKKIRTLVLWSKAGKFACCALGKGT